jgi:hypothetical protein
MNHSRPPRLTFACELDPARLTALFADPSVIADVQALGARIALMLSDLSDERAAVVKQLNEATIPVIGIPLLPLELGYYFTPDNAEHASRRYDEWKSWTDQHQLNWAGVGLDIEPDAELYLQLMRNPWGVLPMLIPRLFDERRVQHAKLAYAAIVDRIHADGFSVENYQFPLIADERWAGSTLLQRLLGLLDVAMDREVWMLYTSVLPGIGPGLLWIYAAEADAVAIGSTGGGPDIPAHPQVPALDWDAFARDLRLAHERRDDLLIHSLEGCVWQGFLERLRTFDWQRAESRPRSAWLAVVLRALLRAVLLSSAHPSQALAAATVLWLLRRRR